MAGPIPVFSFVFAAYAATSGAGARAANTGAAVRSGPRMSFCTAWRLQFARGGVVFAKIAVLEGPGAHLAVSATGEAGEEFWLGGIVESGLGFLGAPVETRRRSQTIAAGQPIRFHVINVLDWRVGVCPDSSIRTPPDGLVPISEPGKS